MSPFERLDGERTAVGVTVSAERLDELEIVQLRGRGEDCSDLRVLAALTHDVIHILHEIGASLPGDLPEPLSAAYRALAEPDVAPIIGTLLQEP